MNPPTFATIAIIILRAATVLEDAAPPLVGTINNIMKSDAKKDDVISLRGSGSTSADNNDDVLDKDSQEQGCGHIGDMCCVGDGDECGCCAPSTCGVVLQLCSLPIEESNVDITYNRLIPISIFEK